MKLFVSGLHASSVPSALVVKVVRMKSWTSPVMNGLAIRPGSERIYFEIVGIVADSKPAATTIRRGKRTGRLFFPYSIQSFSWRTFMARTVVDPIHS